MKVNIDIRNSTCLHVSAFQRKLKKQKKNRETKFQRVDSFCCLGSKITDEGRDDVKVGTERLQASTTLFDVCVIQCVLYR